MALTRLEGEKTITRETLTVWGKRPLVVELYPCWLVIREKGRRKGYTLTYPQAFSEGAKREANERRRVQVEARKLRRRRR